MKPVCIECGQSTSLELYTDYGSGNIRLTQCEACKEFCDKYVECDAVIIFIDMLLHKPEVYRHLLFNRKVEKSHVYRFGFLLLLFDVYIKWYRIEQAGTTAFLAGEHAILMQYLMLFACSLAETLTYHLGVQATLSLLDWIFSKADGSLERATATSTAIILSGFPKLMLILTVIWDYRELNYALIIAIMVFTSNAQALAVLPGRSWYQAFAALTFALMLDRAMAFIVHGIR